MAERWFLFVQFEFPGELGPEDGRYLQRAGEEGEPEHVVVLRTLGAARRSRSGRPARRRRRGREVAPEPEPTPVPVTRATVIDAAPVAAERQASAWLQELDAEHEILSAIMVLNGVLFAHRIAAADPYTSDLFPEQAFAVRAGWGKGEEVAEGRWSYAREVPLPEAYRRRHRQRTSSVLRPQERMTELLSGRAEMLMCEELVLRARHDVNQGRFRYAALELGFAHQAALTELVREGPLRDIAARVNVLLQTHTGVMRASIAAMPDLDPPSDPESAQLARELDQEIVCDALERLEATLRARAFASPAVVEHGPSNNGEGAGEKA